MMIPPSLPGRAHLCRWRLLDLRPIERYLARLDQLAALLECDLALASFAAAHLNIGLSVRSDGAAAFTLPVTVRERIVDLIALPAAGGEAAAFGPGTAVLNEDGLFRARARGAVTLHATPLAWLRSWAAHFAALRAGMDIADPACTMPIAPGFPAMEYPGFEDVCLLDLDAPLLPRFAGVAEITTVDRSFGEAIAARLKAEIAAEEARRAWPKVTLVTQSRSAA